MDGWMGAISKGWEAPSKCTLVSYWSNDVHLEDRLSFNVTSNLPCSGRHLGNIVFYEIGRFILLAGAKLEHPKKGKSGCHGGHQTAIRVVWLTT